MSLINEALKRTRDASLRAAPAGTVADSSYRLALAPAAVARGRFTTVMMGVAAAMGVFTLTALSAGQWWMRQPHEPAPTAVNAPGPVATGAVGGTTSVKSQELTPRATPAAPVDPQVAEEQLVQRLLERIDQARPATAAPAAETPVPVPAEPALVLQGVSRFQGQYEAMISGYTVRTGEEVLGARVVAIEPRTVRLQRGTDEIVLRLR